MEKKQNNELSMDSGETEKFNEVLRKLKEKENVNQAAIDEAREAVGDDAEKIRLYLVNTLGI